MRRFLVFGVSAAMSLLAAPHAGAADGAKPARPDAGKPKSGASRGASALEPASRAETADDAEARRIQSEDERRATESKRKMKKRPGYQDHVQPPRV